MVDDLYALFKYINPTLAPITIRIVNPNTHHDVEIIPNSTPKNIPKNIAIPSIAQTDNPSLYLVDSIVTPDNLSIRFVINHFSPFLQQYKLNHYVL